MNWFKRFWKPRREPLPHRNAPAHAPASWHTEEPMSNFTPRAQQVLAHARSEADRFNHNFVGTEHLLLGLIKLGQGTAVTVLGKMGLDLETVRMEVEKQVGAGPDQKLIGNIPYTPRVKKVLALAAKEARALNHTYVGTEHILLGLMREGDGVAARVLKTLDVDIEQTRHEILRELDPDSSLSAERTEPLPKNESIATRLRVQLPQNPASAKPKLDSIDTSKRYDVYCSERNQDVVVYRSVLFKGVKRLFAETDRDALADFFELEQSNGQIVFVAKYSVIKFCEHGTTPGAESVSDK